MPVGGVPATFVVPPLNAIVGAEVKPAPEAVIVTAVTDPLVRVAVAVAPTPPPPLIVTVGAAVYVCVPELIEKLAAVTPRLGVAAAPLPPPPEKVIVAGAAMPLPPRVTVADATC